MTVVTLRPLEAGPAQTLFGQINARFERESVAWMRAGGDIIGWYSRTQRAPRYVRRLLTVFLGKPLAELRTVVLWLETAPDFVEACRAAEAAYALSGLPAVVLLAHELVSKDTDEEDIASSARTARRRHRRGKHRPGPDR